MWATLRERLREALRRTAESFETPPGVPKPLPQKGFMMDRFEREEIAELHLRCLHSTISATLALFANPLDMGEMARTADLEKDARREFWEALYRLEMADGPKGKADRVTMERRMPRKP